MRTADVVAYFKTQAAVAEALNIRQPSVAEWGDYPPDARQVLIEKITKGALRAEPGCLDRVLGLDKVKEKRAAGKQQRKTARA